MLSITPIYVGILGILFFWLSFRVSLVRLKGPAADEAAQTRLNVRVRTQRNSAEYIPLGLILILVLEFQGAPGWLLHVFGMTLLVGRIGYFIGSDLSPNRVAVQYSMALTYAMLCFSGIAVLLFALVA
jgi:uncharacterized membrane protein YecN with MAPEG domain